MGMKRTAVVVVALIFLCGGVSFANGKGEVKGTITAPISAKTVPQKSPGTASFLSVLMPGLGQVYNGDIGKALVMAGIEGLCWVMVGEELDSIGILGMAVGRLVSGVEAYHSALEKNKLSLRIDNEKVILAVKRNF